jgi:hypothetical protein
LCIVVLILLRSVTGKLKTGVKAIEVEVIGLAK